MARLERGWEENFWRETPTAKKIEITRICGKSSNIMLFEAGAYVDSLQF